MIMTTLDVLKNLAERGADLPVHLDVVRKSLAVIVSADEPANKMVRLARIFRGLSNDDCELALDILVDNWPTKG